MSEHGRCRCPLCVADAVVLLLETGRAGAALAVARDLRPAILDALEVAHKGGRKAAKRRPRAAPPPPPPPPPPAGHGGRGART